MNRLAAGLATLGSAGVITYFTSGGSGAAVILTLAIVLALLPPEYDPVVIWKERQSTLVVAANPVWNSPVIVTERTDMTDQPKMRGTTAQKPAGTKYSAWEWSRGYIVQALCVIFLFPIMALLSGRTLPPWALRKLVRSHLMTTGSRKQDVRIPGVPEIAPYMLRWWKLPRNWAFNIYYHIVKRSDDDTAHHDHPWWSFSIVLDGGYFEERIAAGGVKTRKWYGPGSMLFRRTGKFAHRLVLQSRAYNYLGDTLDGQSYELPVKTIFITGPVLRRWGFHHTDSWVDAYEWDDYCKARGIGGHKMAGYAAQLNTRKD